MGKDSPSPPPAPDYAGAATATAAGNLEATRAAAAANRVNQYTPYGNLIYSHTPVGSFNQTGYDTAMQNYQRQLEQYNNNLLNPSPTISGDGSLASFGGTSPSYNSGNSPVMPDRASFYSNDPDSGWSATQTLSPEQQQILQRNQNLSTGLLGTAETGLGKVNELLSNPTINESKLAEMPISGMSVQNAILSRLEPQIGRQREQLSANLANQGIPIGSEAWKNAMTDQGQKENDLMTQAALQGISTGLGARQQGIQEQAFLQDRPLNVINALRTGSQVTTPQFANVPQQATTTGPNMLGAAQAQGQWDQNMYNAGVANNNAMMGGLFSLGGAALGAPAGTFTGPKGMFSIFSDRRLKSNIHRIGEHPLGIGIYEYDIFDRHETGVLADEVEQIMPQAVMLHPSGFKMVNYTMLGGINA